MNKYTIYWSAGLREVVEGDTFEDAVIKSGRGELSFKYIKFHEEGDVDNYTWNGIEKVWKPIVMYKIKRSTEKTVYHDGKRII